MYTISLTIAKMILLYGYWKATPESFKDYIIFKFLLNSYEIEKDLITSAYGLCTQTPNFFLTCQSYKQIHYPVK